MDIKYKSEKKKIIIIINVKLRGEIFITVYFYLSLLPYFCYCSCVKGESEILFKNDILYEYKIKVKP